VKNKVIFTHTIFSKFYLNLLKQNQIKSLLF
jgi:hypothetical protein